MPSAAWPPADGDANLDGGSDKNLMVGVASGPFPRVNR